MAYVTDSFDDEIKRQLKRGGVGLLPSDTIYGLSCLALNEAAVAKVHKLKDRAAAKPFIILISDLKMLSTLSIPVGLAEPIKQFWPGRLSVIFPADQAPAWLQRGTKTLAVRLPADPQLRKLISQVGPIISTSANLAGDPPVKTVSEARDMFGDQLDFYVEAGRLDHPPSTIVKIEAGQLKLIRQGSVKISSKGESR